MTAAVGTTETYDTVALRESLDSVIWDLFPMDTYFISTVDKVSVGQTQHEWIYDSLAAAAANKQLEGDDATGITQATAIRVSNYTQISRKVPVISGTYEESNVVGGSPMGRAVLKCMKELKRDMEYTCLGKQGSSAGPTNGRATAGVEAWIWGQGAAIPGNTVVPAANTSGTTPSYASSALVGVTDGTTDTSSISVVNLVTALELAWTDGGEPDTIICSSNQKKYIDAMTGVATRTINVGRTEALPIANTANVIVTSFGTAKVVMDRYIHRGTTLCMDMNYWALGQLRAPKVQDLAKTGDAAKKLLIAEYTVIARNPNSSAKLIGFVE